MTNTRLQQVLQKCGVRVDEITGHLSYEINHVLTPLNFELVYVRHGETYANRDMMFQGQGDEQNVDGTGYNQLTPQGVSEAINAGQRLKGLFADWMPDTVLSSPLSRAHVTATIAISESGRDLPIQVYDKLREISFGEWENKKVVELSADLKENAKEYLSYNSFVKAPHGECFQDLLVRASDVFDYLEQNYDKVLVFGHGTLGNAMRILRHILPLNEEGHLSYGRGTDMMPHATPIRFT